MSKGLTCPKCGFKQTAVVETRMVGDYAIRRGRECLNCCIIYKTYEVSANDFDKLKVMEKILDLTEGLC